MLKLLKNNINNNFLIELNLFDNPFYFLHNNKKCEHFSTNIKDFTNGICRFCENLALIEVGPSEKRLKKSYSFTPIFKNLEKIFSWKIPKNDYVYTLYKATFNKEQSVILRDIFFGICRRRIPSTYIDELLNYENIKIIIIKADIDEISEVVGFTIFEDNFNRVKTKDYVYNNDDFYKILSKESPNNGILNILFTYFKKQKLFEEVYFRHIKKHSDMLKDINKKVKEIMENKYIYNILNDAFKTLETITKESYPEIYIELICASEKHKANIGKTMFYFFQNQIKEKIEESSSNEGYISLSSIESSRAYYKKLNFKNLNENDYYKIINPLSLLFFSFSSLIFNSFLFSTFPIEAVCFKTTSSSLSS